MRIRILGPLEVRQGHEWSRIGAPKWRSLLAALVVSPGGALAVDRLVDELWSDKPPRGAVNQIQGYVVRLRRMLDDSDGALLRTHHPGYELALGTDDVDARRFDELARQGESALRLRDLAAARTLLGEALDLWRGPALSDVAGTALVRAEVDRLDERRLATLESRLEADLALARHGELVAELRQLCGAHPYRERLWGQLMLALYRSGRQAEALAAYQDLRDVLDEELGVEPTAALRDLQQQILRADAALDPPATDSAHVHPPTTDPPTTDPPTTEPPTPEPPTTEPPANDLGRTPDGPPSSPVPRQLPADLADFTGRDADVDCLEALLPTEPPDTSTAVVIAVIDGAGGIGKTTLATHWAHRIAHKFPDGQLYVNLRGYDPDEPLASEVALDGFLRSLGVAPARIPPRLDERAALFRSVTAGSRLLVILDNARSADHVRPLLPGTSGCLVLVTSRDDLAGLVARNGARRLTLDRLSPDAARGLLQRILGAARVAAEPEAATAIAELCGGFPLALRVAAERAARRPGVRLADMAAELSDTPRRLDALDLPRDPTSAVREVLSWSYLALPPDGARLFRMLGLHPGTHLSVHAAAALLDVDRATAGRLLDDLAGAHLVETSAAGRYHMHDLLRAYAAETAMLEPESCRRAALDRLLEWYLRTADAAARAHTPDRRHVSLEPNPDAAEVPTFSTYHDALAWYDNEASQLLAVIRAAHDAGSLAVAWKLAAAVWCFAFLRGRWSDWVAAERIALEATRRLSDLDNEAWTLNRLGVAYRELGELDEAAQCFQASVDIRARTGDRFGAGSSLDNLGSTYRLLGRLEESVECRLEALAVQRDIGDRTGEAGTLCNLGRCYLDLDRCPEAFEALRSALAIQQELDDDYGLSMTYSFLGEAHSAVGDHDAAIETFRVSLALHQARDDRVEVARVLTLLGDTLDATGRREAACQHWRKALGFYDEMQDPRADEVRAKLSAAGPSAARTRERSTLG